MFTAVADFEKTWAQESQGTQKVLNALTDGSLSQKVADEHRTLGRVAWHIVTSIAEMMPHTGLKMESVKADAPVPKSAGEIRSAYEAVSDELARQVKANWHDDTLQVEDEFYGETWKRGLTLDILVRHEVHHRGQMTVLMRQAGLKVPGVYGPAKEEWTSYGAPEPEV
ncbi:MAG TPA: DinB family protein [Acidobacteriota bacterium]|nr:DinB family protein [Acidobacteriota bacterium]